MLDELSALSVQAFLCEPVNSAASGDEHGQALKRLQGCIAAAESGVWSLDQLQGLLDDLYPKGLVRPPQLLHVHNAIVCRQSGRALFDANTGLICPGTMLTRLPRHQHVPDVQTFRLDLIQSNQALPRLPKAVFLPSANCIDRAHWLGETQAYLWPFTSPAAQELQGWPVILSRCDAAQPYADQLVKRIRDSHGFPVFEQDLPQRFLIDHAVVPTASYRVWAGFHDKYFDACQGSFDCLHHYGQEDQPVQRSPRVLLMPQEEAVSSSLRSLLGPLSASLKRRGWSMIELDNRLSPQDEVHLTQAEVCVAFTGTGLELLAVLGAKISNRSVILLGSELSVNEAQQLAAQQARGCLINPEHFLRSDVMQAMSSPDLRDILCLEWILERLDQALWNKESGVG